MWPTNTITLHYCPTVHFKLGTYPKVTIFHFSESWTWWDMCQKLAEMVDLSEIMDSMPKASTSPSTPLIYPTEEPPWKDKAKDIIDTTDDVIPSLMSLMQQDHDYEDAKPASLTYTSSSSFRNGERLRGGNKERLRGNKERLRDKHKETPRDLTERPSPATADDYLYDSELIHEDYYYYDDEIPELIVEDVEVKDFRNGERLRDQLNEGPRDLTEKPISATAEQDYLTDLELYDLYDDLAEVLEEMESVLPDVQPRQPRQNKQTQMSDFQGQNVYDYITSKRLKSPYNIVTTRKPRAPNPTRRPRPKRPSRPPPVEKLIQSTSTYVEPYSNQELHKPVDPVKHNVVTSKRSYPTPSSDLGGLKRKPYYQWKQQNPSFYNLTKDLIPDLKDVSKPLNWNVRDFSGWHKMFEERPGVIMDEVCISCPACIREFKFFPRNFLF